MNALLNIVFNTKALAISFYEPATVLRPKNHALVSVVFNTNHLLFLFTYSYCFAANSLIMKSKNRNPNERLKKSNRLYKSPIYGASRIFGDWHNMKWIKLTFFHA